MNKNYLFCIDTNIKCIPLDGYIIPLYDSKRNGWTNHLFKDNPNLVYPSRTEFTNSQVKPITGLSNSYPEIYVASLEKLFTNINIDEYKQHVQGDQSVKAQQIGSSNIIEQNQIDMLNEFLEKMNKFIQNSTPKHRRCKHLVGLPLLGTGYGGLEYQTGNIINVILKTCYTFINNADISMDIVILVRGETTLNALHIHRHKIKEQMEIQEHLDEELILQADQLAELQNKKQIAHFIGAGCSAGCGFPGWWVLINNLTKNLVDKGFISKEDHQNLSKTQDNSLIDWASIIKSIQEKNNEDIQDQIIDTLNHNKQSLLTALLSNLGVESTITTNQDKCIEQALDGCGTSYNVLPQSCNNSSSNFVLKIHGCIDHKKDIVFSRGDYLKNDSNQSALQGIVQTQMITKKLLFVGQSLCDDDFHKMSYQVNKAIGYQRESIVFDLKERPMFNEIFKNFKFIQMSKHQPDGNFPELARLMEIFFDHVNFSKNNQMKYIMNSRFEYLISDQEIEFSKKLRNFMNEISEMSYENRNIIFSLDLYKDIKKLLSNHGQCEEKYYDEKYCLTHKDEVGSSTISNIDIKNLNNVIAHLNRMFIQKDKIYKILEEESINKAEQLITLRGVFQTFGNVISNLRGLKSSIVFPERKKTKFVNKMGKLIFDNIEKMNPEDLIVSDIDNLKLKWNEFFEQCSKSIQFIQSRLKTIDNSEYYSKVKIE